MTEKIMQCCYSNTGASGWQVLAMSENITPQIRSDYAKIQDSNVTSQEPVDEFGNPLKLYEIVADGTLLYLTKVTYGLEDIRGRKNNLFAHTYLFDINNELLENPNIFLAIDDCNFTDNVTDAEKIKRELVRSRNYTLQDALAKCNMDESIYQRLLYTMYAQKESKRPLYIHSSKGSTIMKPFIYCIWKGIPLSMRRKISFASEQVQINSNKTIIFSQNHAESEYFFDIDTGETNVLEEKNIKKYARWGFTDQCLRYSKEEDRDHFFLDLENIAIKLGDAKASKMKILKIAYEILSENLDETVEFEKLQAKLYEVLKEVPMQYTEYTEQYIWTLLKKINDAEFLLADIAEEYLIEKLDGVQSAPLQEEGERYLIRRLTSLSTEKGVEILLNLSENQFKKYCRELQNMDGGTAYIDEYFVTKFPKEITWESLEKYLWQLDEVYECDLYPNTKDKFEAAMKELYSEELKKSNTKIAVYENYVGFADRICMQEDEEVYRFWGKEVYWNQLDLETFSSEKRKEYEFFFIEKNERAEKALRFLRIFDCIAEDQENEMLEQTESFLAENFVRITEVQKKKMYNLLKSAIENRNWERMDLYLKIIKLMLYTGNSDFVQECAEYSESLMDQEINAFVEAYEKNISSLKNDVNKEKIIREYNEYFILYMEKKEQLTDINLDVLLVIGKSMYENPYEILEHLNEIYSGIEKSIEKSAEELVAECVLLKNEEYLNDADKYVHNDGEYKKLVKSWMAEIKRQEKIRRREEKGSILGDFVGKIIPRREEKKPVSKELVHKESEKKKSGHKKRRR